MDCESPRASVPPRHMHVYEYPYMAGRVGPAHLKLVRCDRGTHNRGVSGSTLAKNGVAIRPARLEAPEQIGRVERRGAMLKKMMSKVIQDTHASGRESMDMILSECLKAVNEMTRHGGFAGTLGTLASSKQPGHHR